MEDHPLKIVLCRNLWLGFQFFAKENCHDFSKLKFLSVWVVDVSERVHHITTHAKVKRVCFVSFYQLVVECETCLEHIFKRFYFFRFQIEKAHFYGEVLGQFWNLVDVFFCNWRIYCCSPTVERPTESGLLEFLQGLSHWRHVADLRRGASFMFLKKSQGSGRGFLWTTVAMWGATSGSNQLSWRTDRSRTLLRDEHHFWNDLHFIPFFLCLCSGIFRQRFWIVSVSAGSRELRLV